VSTAGLYEVTYSGSADGGGNTRTEVQ